MKREGNDPGDVISGNRPDAGPVLTDALLEELKAQGAPGCLLCSLDEWDEDWD